MPIRPTVPSGAMRMIHHSTFWMTSSVEAEKSRKGLAFSPSLRAATPTAIEMTRICRMLKLTEVDREPSSAAVVEADRPRKLEGISPCRKAHQLPVLPSYSGGAAWPVPTPGCMTAPITSPITTAMNEVMANHSRVLAASRAALVTCARFAIEATTAKNTRGTTAARSSET